MEKEQGKQKIDLAELDGMHIPVCNLRIITKRLGKYEDIGDSKSSIEIFRDEYPVDKRLAIYNEKKEKAIILDNAKKGTIMDTTIISGNSHKGPYYSDGIYSGINDALFPETMGKDEQKQEKEKFLIRFPVIARYFEMLEGGYGTQYNHKKREDEDKLFKTKEEYIKAISLVTLKKEELIDLAGYIREQSLLKGYNSEMRRNRNEEMFLEKQEPKFDKLFDREI